MSKGRRTAGFGLLCYLLFMSAYAASAQAGLEPVSPNMIHGNVLSDPKGKFEIGTESLPVKWYKAPQAKFPSYAAIDNTAHRVYAVAYFPKESGDTLDQTVKGAFEGMRRWAAANKAIINKTSSKSSDQPLPNSTRIMAEGTLQNGKNFYAIQVLVFTDSVMCNISTYALSQTDLNDFDKFVASFKVTK
ncbi:MAG TPA: hypothetical protein VKZ53_16015 [Candidatus Angelobacter sp.]|nr:hypothetical protein [Candidatus Angelobacter sp.]